VLLLPCSKWLEWLQWSAAFTLCSFCLLTLQPHTTRLQWTTSS